MERESTRIVTQEKTAALGAKMRSTEVWSSSTPSRRISTATPILERYSYRAWPKGCPASAGRAARRKAARETTELPVSERLFTPSAVMATLPVTAPTRSFPAERRRFTTIPTMLPRRP